MSNAPLVIFPPVATDPNALDLLELDRIDPAPSRIFQYAYPGHGGRPRPEGFTFREVMDEVAAQLEAAGEGPADIAGIGIGAYVLTEFLLHRPELVRSGIVACSPLGPVPDEWRENDRQLGRSARSGMDDLIEPTLRRWFTGHAVDRDIPGIALARERLSDLDPLVWEDIWLAIAGRSTLDADQAARIDKPITIVAPLHDSSPNLRRLRELHDMLPLSRLLYVDGPHMVHLERPLNLLAALDSHLAWLADGAPPIDSPLYWVGA